MASFDISSKVDLQNLDNAINVARKEINTRYDFKGSHVLLDLDKKNYLIKIETDSEMQMEQVQGVLLSKAMRQGVDAKAFDFSKAVQTSGKFFRKEVPVSNGLSREQAKNLVKLIKDSKLKVTPAIMDDVVRVTGKKIDDLQAVIQLCKQANLDMPLQFINMKS